MLQQFHWHNGEAIPLHPGKAVCVGRNYVAHAAELGNEVPEEPLLFIKPSTALTALSPSFTIPQGCGEVHHETELALLIGHPLTRASAEQAAVAIIGIGIALDLTLRDQQNQLKTLRQPWEKAKAFDDSCPVSCFLPIGECPPWDDIPFSLHINGELRQSGNSRLMIWSMLELTAAISHHFTLCPGDLVLTGTPAGVGPLHPGDQLQLQLAQRLHLHSKVVPVQPGKPSDVP